MIRMNHQARAPERQYYIEVGDVRLTLRFAFDFYLNWRPTTPSDLLSVDPPRRTRKQQELNSDSTVYDTFLGISQPFHFPKNVSTNIISR